MMSYNSPFTGNVIQPTDVAYRGFSISVNTQLEWPINGNATNDYAARIMEVTATVGSLLLKMPPANQASVGNDALIRNVGGNTFTVADFDGNTIVSIAPGEAKYIYIETNPDEAGTWGVIAFGVGTSNVDAATLAGYGLLAVGNTLNQSHPVNSLSNDVTVDATDRAKAFLWTGGNGTITLTSAASVGNNWFVLVRNGGTGNLALTPPGGEQIDNEAVLNLQPSDSCLVISSGSEFFTVGIGQSTEFNFTQLTKAVVSGTYTLTSAEAANVIQKYTGTLTGNVTVILPPTIQVYYIQNQTDGTPSNYTITFQTSAPGATSAIVAAGQQVTLVCDSVNLLNANTVQSGLVTASLADGSASVPSLAFATEPSTGVFRPGTGQFGISILGTKRFDLAASGLTITGTGTFTNGVLGGTF